MLAIIVVIIIVALVAAYVVRRGKRLRAARKNKWVEIIDAEGEHHQVPVPPFSNSANDPSKTRYFTTATTLELKIYYHQTIPAAGWDYVDMQRVPAGIVVLFRRGNKRLTILNGTGRDFLKGDPVGDTLTYNIDVNVEPSSLEQDLVHISDLSKSGNHDAVDSLIAFLDDSRWRMRQEAINALAVVKDKRATPFLIARLADEESGVRQSSASALAKLGDYEAVEPLIVSLNKDDPFVKASCARALGELKDVRAVKPLIAALQNDYLILVANAATALGEIGDRSAIEPLKAHLKDSKNDAVTRVMAGRAIEKLMDPIEFRVMVESIRSEVSHSPDSHVNEGFAENIAETATETLFDLLGIDY